MPRVASEPTVPSAQQYSLGPQNRAGGADEISSVFALMVETAEVAAAKDGAEHALVSGAAAQPSPDLSAPVPDGPKPPDRICAVPLFLTIAAVVAGAEGSCDGGGESDEGSADAVTDIDEPAGGSAELGAAQAAPSAPDQPVISPASGDPAAASAPVSVPIQPPATAPIVGEATPTPDEASVDGVLAAGAKSVPDTSAADLQDAAAHMRGSDQPMTADEVAPHEAQPRRNAAPASDRAKESAPAKGAGTDAADTAATEAPGGGPRTGAKSTTPDAARGADRPDRPHHRADASKPGDAPNQPLGTPVSEATHTAKPPSEAMPAILQASDRPLGPSLQPAPTPTPAVHEPLVPIAGLAVEIAARTQAGRNRFEIRLDPPDLGRIDVRLDVDQSGQVTSRLVVERVETLEHLRRDAADLERALQQAGLKTADNGLQFTLRDQGFARRDDGGAAPETARLVVPDPELAPVDTLQGRYGRTWRASGIDIRV